MLTQWWNGLCTTSKLGAPFIRRLPTAKVNLNGGGSENPVVTWLPQHGLYIALFDDLFAEAKGFGVTFSSDGLSWATPAAVVAVPGGARTPMASMLEDDGSLTVFFTDYGVGGGPERIFRATFELKFSEAAGGRGNHHATLGAKAVPAFSDGDSRWPLKSDDDALACYATPMQDNTRITGADAAPSLKFDDSDAQAPPPPTATLLRRNWGINIHFNSASKESVALLRKGFTAIRQDVAWETVENVAAAKGQKGIYNWSVYETLFDDLGKDVVPYMILDYGNLAYGTNATAANDWIVISKENTAAQVAFVKYAIAAMRHFRGRGILWELWNEPNGIWCCGHLEPDVYASLALAISDAKNKLSPELDGEVLAGPTTCGCDLAYMEAVFSHGALAAFDAISWHPYRGGAPESVSADYAAVRALARKYLKGNTSVPPIISGEWGYATCLDEHGSPVPCIGGATGGNTVSIAQQGAFLARQWIVNAMDGIPLSIWYDWSDSPNCNPVKPGSDCYGVFEVGALGEDGAAHGKAKAAFFAAKQMQKQLGARQYVRRLETMTPPAGQTVESSSNLVEGSGCLSITAQSDTRTKQDQSIVFVAAFGKNRPDKPPVAANPSGRIEAFAVWSTSDLETSTVVVESSLKDVCFNSTTLYGVQGSHSYCYNSTGHMHVSLLTQPTFYTRL